MIQMFFRLSHLPPPQSQFDMYVYNFSIHIHTHTHSHNWNIYKKSAMQAVEEMKRMAKAQEAKLLKMPLKEEQDPNWQGVTLRGDKLNGSISGTMHLPRMDYFEISVVITKTRPLELDQGHVDDSITVRMGPDMKKLVKVCVC
jgi:hypothetical protein